MKCVILQPSYIPWRGYFHQIQRADVFIFLDDVQYDKHGWRNRNRIKTPSGPIWLTVPVKSRGNVEPGIPTNRVNIAWDREWNRKHLLSIEQSYSRAPFFGDYFPQIEAILGLRHELLADLTIELSVALSAMLGIKHTRFIRASTLSAKGSKTDRLITMLQEISADHYISGPSAGEYIESHKFAQAGIALEYMRYDYTEYPQLYPPFDPQVSILDLLFMTGGEAHKFIWSP